MCVWACSVGGGTLPRWVPPNRRSGTARTCNASYRSACRTCNCLAPRASRSTIRWPW